MRSVEETQFTVHLQCVSTFFYFDIHKKKEEDNFFAFSFAILQRNFFEPFFLSLTHSLHEYEMNFEMCVWGWTDEKWIKTRAGGRERERRSAHRTKIIIFTKKQITVCVCVCECFCGLFFFYNKNGSEKANVPEIRGLLCFFPTLITY